MTNETMINPEMTEVKTKRRGRQTQNIKNAFNAVTDVPVLLETHAKTWGVSEKVLRQAKRFDVHNVQSGLGKVRVTQVNRNAGDHNLYIYRVKTA